MNVSESYVANTEVNRFFSELQRWIDAGKGEIPVELNLKRAWLRKTVLPLACLSARLTDQHQDIADLIDATLPQYIVRSTPQSEFYRSEMTRSLRDSLDVLCYIGFRRAQIVSAPLVLAKIQEIMDADFTDVSENYQMSADDFRFLMGVLSTCRVRLDTQERHAYSRIILAVLELLQTYGARHIDLNTTYQLQRWFVYTMRIMPQSYAPFIKVTEQIAANYFVRNETYVPKGLAEWPEAKIKRLRWSRFMGRVSGKVTKRQVPSPHNIVKEVAVTTTMGSADYGLDAIKYLEVTDQSVKKASKKRTVRGRMVEVAYVAGADAVYGKWRDEFRSYLLDNPHKSKSRLVLGVKQQFGLREEAFKGLIYMPRAAIATMHIEATYLRYMSQFLASHELLSAIRTMALRQIQDAGRAERKLPNTTGLMQLFWSIRMKDEIDYVLAAAAALETDVVPDVASPLIVLCPSSFSAFFQMPIHVLANLKSKGSPVISLTPGYITSDPVSEDIDTHVSDTIYPHYFTDSTSQNKEPCDAWGVDIARKQIVLNGINFYYTIHNTLGITFRCYDIEWDCPVVSSHTRRYQTAIEAMFDKHARILAHAKKTGQKAKILLTEIQHGLSHALRLISRELKSDDFIEVFHICNGFEAYHNNIERTESAQFQCIANVTEHPEVSLAYRPYTGVLTNWMETATPDARQHPDALAYAAKVDAQADPTPYTGELKFPGRPVIILLGKILPDLPRPHDKGFIHEDVKEWFLDCCKIAHEQQVNLLVKPHPAEHASRISLYVNQEFTSFLDDLPSDMHPVVLDRTSYPITKLQGTCDGIIMWGGNSTVETGLLKIPTMVSGYYGAMDCPIGQHTSETREQLVQFLTGQSDNSNLDQIRENTIAFLSYVLHPNHTIPSRFNNRSMYNSEVWPPKLYQFSDEDLFYANKMANYILGESSEIIPGGALSQPQDL